VSRYWRCACAGALLAVHATAVLAQQYFLAADAGTTNAAPFKHQVGRRLTFICPADPAAVNWSQDIWGTDVYAAESNICWAAVHAGVITPGQASQVTIVMLGPADSFEGTVRNGIASQSYGPWDGSYAFSRSGEPGQVDWNTNLRGIAQLYQEPITVTCPPDGDTSAYVGGTDVYTYDSAICVAAVHAGAITQAAGGTVTVTRVPQQDSYPATVRNGVSSETWPCGDPCPDPLPYRVARAPIVANVPTAFGARSGPRLTATDLSRTVNLAGVTASGTSVPVAARTITLAGITARGTSAPVAARTIRLAGITATGTSAPVAARTISLAGITAHGASTPVAAQTITLAGITARGTSVSVAPRTIPLVGWTGQGSTGLP
jgi:hypothetical protein